MPFNPQDFQSQWAPYACPFPLSSAWLLEYGQHLVKVAHKPCGCFHHSVKGREIIKELQQENKWPNSCWSRRFQLAGAQLITGHMPEWLLSPSAAPSYGNKYESVCGSSGLICYNYVQLLRAQKIRTRRGCAANRRENPLQNTTLIYKFPKYLCKDVNGQ